MRWHKVTFWLPPSSARDGGAVVVGPPVDASQPASKMARPPGPVLAGIAAARVGRMPGMMSPHFCFAAFIPAASTGPWCPSCPELLITLSDAHGDRHVTGLESELVRWHRVTFWYPTALRRVVPHIRSVGLPGDRLSRAVCTALCPRTWPCRLHLASPSDSAAARSASVSALPAWPAFAFPSLACAVDLADESRFASSRLRQRTSPWRRPPPVAAAGETPSHGTRAIVTSAAPSRRRELDVSRHGRPSLELSRVGLTTRSPQPLRPRRRVTATGRGSQRPLF